MEELTLTLSILDGSEEIWRESEDYPFGITEVCTEDEVYVEPADDDHHVITMFADQFLSMSVENVVDMMTTSMTTSPPESEDVYFELTANCDDDSDGSITKEVEDHMNGVFEALEEIYCSDEEEDDEEE